MSQLRVGSTRSTAAPQVAINFLFDIIVTRLQLNKDKIDKPEKLTVNMKVNKLPITITQSRVNVSEFKEGSRIDIVCEPRTLRKSFENDGIPIVLRYSGVNLGTAQIKFQQTFIDRIAEGMSDLIHAESASIIRRDEEVGELEVLCFLTIKCDDPGPEFDADKKSCINMGKAINPPDIMFVVGAPETCPPCEPCEDDLEPEEGDERLKLDLARYPTVNKRVTEPPEEICGTDACCQLKSMTVKYGEIIDSIVREVAQLPTPMPVDDHQFTDWSGKPPMPTFKYTERTIPVPVGDMEELGVKPIRFCPVCLTAMSWLPKYATCPTCSAKAMPEIDENSGETLTANQIIQQYLKAPAKTAEDYCEDPCQKKENGSKPSKNDLRCTCKNGKFCPHCRIRHLCADIFRKRDAPQDCPIVEPKSNEDFCVIVDSNDQCRPYLERVFAELSDLYQKRDAKKMAELNKRCTDPLFKFGNGRSDVTLPELANKSSTGANLKSVGSPTFLHRQYGPKIGHKTCLRPHSTVSRRHGWSWPSSKAARKHGWRPGAICRYAGTIMKFFLQYSPEDNAFNTCRRAAESLKEKEREKPILNVCKRNGELFITLRGVNNPHVEMKPIVFKVVKSDLAVSLRQIKQKLKGDGFRKCTCHQTVMLCVCRNNFEKKQLENAVQKESKRHGMENCVDHLVLTDTSDSEMEYSLNVTPPAGVARPLCSIKPRTINHSTQTAKKDLKVALKYPVKLSPYWRSYDCAAGDRYTGTAFGGVGEEPFEDGVFGHRGGGPHGASATPGGRPKNKGVWGAKPGGPMRGGGRDGAGGGRGKPGGGGGFGGGYGGKSFPVAKKSPGGKKSEPIPVRMPKRHYQAIEQAAKAEKEAKQHQLDQKKQGPNMIKYLEKKGAVATPWNPNEPKKEVPTKSGPIVGKDGLTDAQRKRRELLQAPIPPFESLARLGKGYDPCIAQCYGPCDTQCCYPSGYYC